jgi:hypothetical protein
VYRPLRKKIMTDEEFRQFTRIMNKLSGIPSKKRIIGSSVSAYFMAKEKISGSLHNKDIDLQIYVSIDNFQKVASALMEERLVYQKGSQGYTQFVTPKEEKITSNVVPKKGRQVEITVIPYKGVLYPDIYDQIEIGKVGLDVNEAPKGYYYFTLDEKVKILEDAFKNGVSNIDLSGNLANVTCLFSRIFKHAQKYKGILKSQFIFPAEKKNDVIKVMMDNTWNHPIWKAWLEDYYFQGVQTGEKDYFYKELGELIKHSYVHDKKSDCLLFVFFQTLFPPSTSRIISFIPTNLISLFRLFCKNYNCLSDDLKEVISSNVKEVIFQMVETVKKDRDLSIVLIATETAQFIVDTIFQKMVGVIPVLPTIPLYYCGRFYKDTLIDKQITPAVSHQLTPKP